MSSMLIRKATCDQPPVSNSGRLERFGESEKEAAIPGPFPSKQRDAPSM